MLVLISAVAILGLVIGSFLNVVVHRVPRGESVVRPGSHCPECGCAVRARHNLPVLGYLLLKGRCADCHNPISMRYPLVELATALVFAALTARMLQLGLLTALPAYLFFAAIGIALGLIDLDTLRLPDSVVYPSCLVLGYLGYPALVVGVAIALALIALVGVLGPIIADRSGHRSVPFAPVLVVGALLALFGSAPLVHTCTRLVQRV